MRVAIVGSRNFPRLDWVREEVSHLHPGDVVVSGGARGVDRCAVRAAKARGLLYEEIPVPKADWALYGKHEAARRRNTKIVERSDKVIAFWDGASRGTLMTIQIALSKKVPVVIVTGNAEKCLETLE